MNSLTTWGENIDPSNVLSEYPRPQLVRNSYQNLNGIWDYAVTETEAAPDVFGHQILVPFSPEAPLSGVNRTLEPHEFAWYRTSVELNSEIAAQLTQGNVLRVHFGAVDQEAWVYVDNALVVHHVGGYLPFYGDCAPLEPTARSIDVLVKVRDRTDTVPLSRGKQRTKRGGIWYTPQSGIWQTVWLETVPVGHIERVDYVVHESLDAVSVTVSGPAAEAFEITVAHNNTTVAQAQGRFGDPLVLSIPNAKVWSPETPELYDVSIRTANDDVTSYFAMRTTGMGPDHNGVPRLLLNGKPYFHVGVLDQGYWPDGLYTAPSDEAFVWDIQTMKSMGYNMLRKHIKVEPMRFYYHCDRIGMLVWQDMINGGGTYRPDVITAPVALPVRLKDNTARAYKLFGRNDQDGREQFEAELVEMINHLRAVPSIVLWVPFNEGWGQFDAVRIARMVRTLDPTRIIDHASGWHDQRVSDVRSLHVYFKKFRVPKNDGTGRALVLSEYGGYNYEVPGTHTTAKTFGYKKIGSPKALLDAFSKLHLEQIAPAVAHGLSAVVYTQVSDVEDEMNGLVSYDRKHIKMPAEITASINAAIVSNM